MRYLLLLSLLLLLVSPSQNPAVSQEGPSVIVLGFKCSKARQTPEKLGDPTVIGPVAAVEPFNKVRERNARANAPAGTRDPNVDTVDGRSAALEKIVQESRTPLSKPVDGFGYRLKVQNTSAKVVEIIFWEYQFIDRANPAVMARRQFLCGVNIKPDKAKELQPSMIFGDLTIKGMGGEALCGALKRQSETKDIPFVVVSGDRDVAEKARICGADDYMGKPFEFEDLIRIVNRYVRAESRKAD